MSWSPDVARAAVVFGGCMILSALAVWRLSPPYVTYDTQPFPWWAYVALAAVAFVPGSSLLVGAAAANMFSQVVWEGTPNYIWVGHRTFNVADLTILAGVVVISKTAWKRRRT